MKTKLIGISAMVIAVVVIGTIAWKFKEAKDAVEVTPWQRTVDQAAIETESLDQQRKAIKDVKAAYEKEQEAHDDYIKKLRSDARLEIQRIEAIKELALAMLDQEKLRRATSSSPMSAREEAEAKSRIKAKSGEEFLSLAKELMETTAFIQWIESHLEGGTRTNENGVAIYYTKEQLTSILRDTKARQQELLRPVFR